MDIFDLLKLSTRMFAVRASRTALTVLGMGVGIGVILFLFSFGYGLQKTLLEKITTSDSILTLDVMEQKNGDVKLDRETVDKIIAFPGAEEVSPVSNFRASGGINNITAEITAAAVLENYFRLGGMKPQKGEYFSDSSSEEAIISSSLAGIFGESRETSIGKSLTINFFAPANADDKNENNAAKEKVILQKTYKIIGISEGKKNVVFVPSKTVQSIEGGRFSQLKVRSKGDQEMKIVREKLTSMGLSVSALSDTVAQANKVFRFFQVALLFFGVVALLVSAIGMFNTMTVTLLERTEEIGIMKSVGASATEISLIFLTESLIMGLLGGVVGIILGIASGEAFNLMVNMLALYFGGERVDLFFCPAWFASSIFVFSGLVGILTGFFPARRAGKINPLDALRYK